MSVQNQARNALAAIMEQHSTGAVTVVVGSDRTTGFVGVTTTDTDLSMYGERGETNSLVRVDASKITTPGRGDTITVDGAKVFVIRTHPDPIGALLTIEHSTQHPVED